MGRRESLQYDIENIRQNISSRLEHIDDGNHRGASEVEIIKEMINDFEERFVSSCLLGGSNITI